MMLYKISLLSLPPSSLSAFHVGGIFKCLVFFECALIIKPGTQRLWVPGCAYPRMGFIKIDGSVSYRCHGKTIYFLGLFNSCREESSSLFSEGILEIIADKGTGDSSFYYVNFHFIFLQGALRLLFSVQNISGAIFLENKSQSLSWSEDREIIAWLQCMVMGPSPSFLLRLQDLTTNTTVFSTVHRPPLRRLVLSSSEPFMGVEGPASIIYQLSVFSSPSKIWKFRVCSPVVLSLSGLSPFYFLTAILEGILWIHAQIHVFNLSKLKEDLSVK